MWRYNQLVQRGYTFLNVTRLNQYCPVDIERDADKVRGLSFIAVLVQSTILFCRGWKIALR